jgi:hypothetical protein
MAGKFGTYGTTNSFSFMQCSGACQCRSVPSATVSSDLFLWLRSSVFKNSSIIEVEILVKMSIDIIVSVVIVLGIRWCTTLKIAFTPVRCNVPSKPRIASRISR